MTRGNRSAPIGTYIAFGMLVGFAAGVAAGSVLHGVLAGAIAGLFLEILRAFFAR